jgi:hypothetical protein
LLLSSPSQMHDAAMGEEAVGGGEAQTAAPVARKGKKVRVGGCGSSCALSDDDYGGYINGVGVSDSPFFGRVVC